MKMSYNFDYENVIHEQPKETDQNIQQKQEIINDPVKEKQIELSNIHDINVGKVVYLGFLFFLMFTIFNGLQNIITLLYTQLGYPSLGAFTMLTIFVVRAISNLFGPALADKYSYNHTFFTASSSILLFLLFGRLATYCDNDKVKASYECNNTFLYVTHFFGAAAFGFFGSILWATQSSYVNECASVLNKGKLFGIFWSFVACSQITGNALTTVVLKTEGADGLFSMYIVLAIIVVVLFWFVKDPHPIEHENIAVNQDIIDKKLSSAPNDDNAIIIHNNTIPGLDNMPTTNTLPSSETEFLNPDNQNEILRFFKFFLHPKIKACLPLFLLQGYSFTIFITTMSVMVYNSLTEGTQGDKNQKVGIVFLIFGFAEVIAGQVFGWIFDKIRKYCITTYCFVNVACIISLYTGFLTDSYTIYIISAIFYAFSDVGGETVIGGLLSIRFKEKVEPFVVFRCISTCGAAAIMGVYMFFPDLNPLFMVVGLFSIIIAATWYHREDLQTQEQKKYTERLCPYNIWKQNIQCIIEIRII